MRELNQLRVANLHCATAHLTRVVAVLLVSVLVLFSQESKPPQPAKDTATPSSPSASNSLPPIQLDGSAVLYHLNQLISWYRHSTTGIQSVGLASDAIYQDNAKNLG